MGNYDDIIHLPHPVSARHPQMSLSDRAAQFSPFAALTGHGSAIAETARQTKERPELGETRKSELDMRLQLLRESLSQEAETAFTYFVPDPKKAGGACVRVTGIVKKMDDIGHNVILKDGTIIPIDDIYEIESVIFAH